MSSVTSPGARQVSNNGGYFIPVGDCRGKIYAINGSAVTIAEWASTGYAVGVVSSLQGASNALGAGVVLRDMGKTVVSSSRTFRKVQYVVPANLANSTFGVSGNTVAGESYLTGYIELGFGGEGGTGLPTPVAHYGR